MAIAQEQGYTPNVIARSLVTRSSGVIGVVLGQVQDPFYAEPMERLHEQPVGGG